MYGGSARAVWEISEFTRVYVVQSDLLMLWLMGFVLCVCSSSLTKTVEISGEQGPLGIHVVPYCSSLRKVSAAFLTLSPPQTQTHTFPWCMSYLKHGDVCQRNLKHRTHSELCLCLSVFWCGGLWECFVLLSCFWSHESEVDVWSF